MYALDTWLLKKTCPISSQSEWAYYCSDIKSIGVWAKLFWNSFFYSLHYKSCTCNNKKENLRFPHSPIHLLCILILTLFILTHCEKQHEIAACIINVWSFTEVLPKIKTTTTKKNLVPKTTSLFLTKLYPLVTEKVAWHLSNGPRKN